ncbi:uncharacterized protein LOC126842666 [Adelges cooleyi]|uniref:uncharacterized protein LOC126842666 n=1 Tax=Adelges cooleyi TaxID=133065 RepID=UPI00217F3D2B|nr:uncharacterized protein LOC126842666 [Adelges cooleyi]
MTFYKLNSFVLFYFCITSQLTIQHINGAKNYIKVFPKVGENITLNCGNIISKHADILWKMNHKELPGRAKVLKNGDLFISTVDISDSGIYICDLGTANNYVGHAPLAEIELKAISLPGPLLGVKVIPYTVLLFIRWEAVKNEGESPVANVTIRVKEINNSSDNWLIFQTDITSLQKEIYHLQPNTLYTVEMWASNIVGNGEKKVINTQTLSEMSEDELEKHLLEGIDKFDTRAWMFAVVVIMSTFSIFGIALCYLLIKDPRIQKRLEDGEDVERIELIPNITLNPGYCET